MAEKFSWDQANIRQKLGFVWRNRKKISQSFNHFIKDYFYLPFFLLIILWLCSSTTPKGQNRSTRADTIGNNEIRNNAPVPIFN
jgi:hypothetical protein